MIISKVQSSTITSILVDVRIHSTRETTSLSLSSQVSQGKNSLVHIANRWSTAAGPELQVKHVLNSIDSFSPEMVAKLRATDPEVLQKRLKEGAREACFQAELRSGR